METKPRKVIEIIEMREAKPNRTGSLFDYQQGYPEKQWERMKQLETGSLLETDKVISFRNSNGEEIGIGFLKDGFVHERTKDFISYGGGFRQNLIVKSLIEPGIFEIHHEVGHFCKLRVEPSPQDAIALQFDFFTQVFNSGQLSLLSIGFMRDFLPKPQRGSILFKEMVDGKMKFYFEPNYYEVVKVAFDYYKSDFQQSNSAREWLELKSKVDTAIEEKNVDSRIIDELKEYDLFL